MTFSPFVLHLPFFDGIPWEEIAEHSRVCISADSRRRRRGASTHTGARRGGGALSVRAPALPPAFHTLAKGIYLDRGATLFYTGTKAMHYLILPIINIPAPPSKNHPVAPLLNSNPFICNMI